MQRFVQLFTELDSTTKTSLKQKALISYFEEAEDKDKVWAVALFTHRRPKRSVVTTRLREWTAEELDYPQWLIDDCYHIVGDLAETLALFNGNRDSKGSDNSLDYWIRYLDGLRTLEEEEKRTRILEVWKQMGPDQQFVFNKLITGGFRVGVSAKTVINALATHLNEDPSNIALRLMGNWDPFEVSFEKLLVEGQVDEDDSKPYPFYLAYPWEGDLEDLGQTTDWFAEWKWDGIRCQLISRNGEIYLWSRGEELISDSFPEFRELREKLPEGLVIDGELLVVRDGLPAPFNDLQKRLGRKKPGKGILQKYPCAIMAYDLLEIGGVDIRKETQEERRGKLEELMGSISHRQLLLSPLVSFSNWDELGEKRETAREHLAEGFMLKNRKAEYKVGRKRGDWWKWKVDPLTVDGVMIYAQRGHGRRANLYTDFTFAVWDGDRLVPFTKAYSGLTDEEFKEVNKFIRENTIDRFGPVRSVKPELVFELAFEGIAKSNRHKSGVALRFPRIKRWRKDKPASEANSLEDLEALIPEGPKI
jgi:DNA ligase-1